jgi:mono/diheme cytochrome c family protein
MNHGPQNTGRHFPRVAQALSPANPVVPAPKTRLALAFLCTVSAFGAAPTFNRDIAPILYESCAGCHRPGQVAPFGLLTYQDAAKRAGLIAAVTQKRYMPPWKAEPGYGHFQDERRLTDAQIARIAEWARAGAPEGDAAQRPKPPEFASGWIAGKPDAILTPSRPFEVPADGRDVFQCFVIPTAYDTERYVKTVEFHPGNPRVVHHALFFVDTSGVARRLAAEGGGSYPCFGGPRITPAGGLGGWAPGAIPEPLPVDIGYIIEKGADVVVQLHYHPDGRPEMDQSSIGVTFTDQPHKGLTNIVLGSRRLDFPAGEANIVITSSAIVPQDVELIGITPHAHWLAKEMKVEAKLPGGKVEPLIWIRDWDFNWQGTYRYAAPIRLPKGTRVEMRFTYDNSAANPRNPSSPPKPVHFGEQTTDEMAFTFLQVALPSREDVPGFRKAQTLSRIEQMIIEGDDFSSLNRQQAQGLRTAIQMFDSNHDGRLDDSERAALMKFLEGYIK